MVRLQRHHPTHVMVSHQLVGAAAQPQAHVMKEEGIVTGTPIVPEVLDAVVTIASQTFHHPEAIGLLPPIAVHVCINPQAQQLPNLFCLLS